ncbi:hypothetical protein BH11PSE1_BH11PSE1_27640 [soil metagenome]
MSYIDDRRNRIGLGEVFDVQTLTEIVAAVVVHSSAVAYSHFGVAIESPKIEHPAPAERTIARTATPKPAAVKVMDHVQKAPDCPTPKGQVLKT